MYLKQRISTIPIISYKLVVWGIALFCLLITWDLIRHSSLSDSSANFLMLFTVALVLWISRLVPENVPAILIIIFTPILDIKEEATLLSGFASDSFFQTVSLFGIAFVLIKSGLFYRCSLYILYYLPPKQALLQKVIFGIGALLTPIVSVQSTRMALMAPLLDDLLNGGRISPKSSAANALASSAFNGCILFSTIFLTGKSSNSVLQAMLSASNTGSNGWFSWLIAASFPGILLAGAFFMLNKWFFKQQQTIYLNKLRIKRELSNLKQLSIDEKTVLISISILFIGFLFSSYHYFSSLWICIAVYLVLFLNGCIAKSEFKKGINWQFLFYFGAIIGIMRHLQNTGIDYWLSTHLTWIINFSQGNIIMLIVCIYIISWLCALILGTMTAPALLLTVFLPMTQSMGVNGWIVAFTILMATEAWIFPYQSSYYLCFRELLDRNKRVQFQPLLQMNALLVPIKLGILLLSVPFWHVIGIIT